ncbi:flavodoxin family protein [Sellimonas caecigallum]|uniref:Flavodoxin family protein n=1 Tax=Sellimonas caecigallum TaxID=2592333 RepID=A0ABS7L626_9FIRM|nr:flavodoxin family protein [Sellimonas caecigallum]MBY0758501.1 flavodoxin family protein [Sellimonas caecigallum]
MKKRVLVISTSLRNNSNSEILADAFLDGAQSAGHEAEKVSLKNKTLAFCRGCLACQKTGNCVIHDDAEEILEKMSHADVLVFATPIYYYEMSGQMKTLIDRANPLFTADYAYRKVYLLATAAEDDTHAMDGALKGLQGFIDCYEKAELAGTVFAGGVDAPGTAEDHAAVKEAYEMGRQV